MVVKIELLKTEYCVFCPQASVIVHKVAKEFGNKVEVKEVYLDKDDTARNRAIELGIFSVPTILINGLPTLTGVPRESLLKDLIKQAIEKGL